MRLKHRYQLAIIVFLVLVAYYPASQAGIARIDDAQLFAYLDRATGLDLQAVLFPKLTGASYYRPVLFLSYFIDKIILGLMPGPMHIENIALHILNAALVFLLVRRAMTRAAKPASWMPLGAALLFGLHPVAAESVNWISGRTDVLACSFVLISTFLLVRSQELDGPAATTLSVLSLFALLCAVLTKETAMAFLPGYLLLMQAMSKDAGSGAQHSISGSAVKPTPNRTMMLIGTIAVLLLIILFRNIAIISHSSRVRITQMAISADWMHSMMVVLRAFGFYIKKIVCPSPLNFSILEIDPLYEVLAVPLVIVAVVLATKRTLTAAFFATGIFLVLPAFILAFNQVAWTPYAERYVYLALPFMIIAAAQASPERILGRRGAAVVAVVLLIMLAATFQRSDQWRNEFLLVKDTVNKSPLSREMRSLYAAMLAERGAYDEAMLQVRAGMALPTISGYDAKFDMTTAFIAAVQGRDNEAIDLYRKIARRAPDKAQHVLPNLIALLRQEHLKEKNLSEKQSIEKQIIKYNIQLYEITGEPYLLYKIGNDAVAMRRSEHAIPFYDKVLTGLKNSDQNRRTVGILRERLVRLSKRTHVEND